MVLPKRISVLAWIVLPCVTSFVFFPTKTHHHSSVSLQGTTFDEESPSASYLATCIPGLSQCLADELVEIHPDITDITVSGNAAVTFVATREASLHVMCWTRTAHRVLELVASTSSPELHDRNDLHSFIDREVDVKNLLGDGQGGLLSLSVKAILNNPRQIPQDLTHSHYTALTIKNALCDIVRDMRGDRPDVDIDNPDVPLVAMLLGNSNGGASISLFKSLHPPGSLHKRGYRQGVIHKAAMKESLASGLLRQSGWHEKLKTAKENDDYQLRLIDPMCGSGSLVLEAAMMAADIAPGLMRIRCHVPNHASPPVTRWKSETDTEMLWKQCLLDATKRAKSGLEWIRKDRNKLILYANDIHPGAVDILESSAQAAGLLSFIEITNMDCYDLEVDTENIPYFVVTNPPWGLRLTDDIEESWDGLRHFLRDICPDSTEAWVLSGDKSATKILRLRREKMVPIQTGEQHLRWIQYMIRGSQEMQLEKDKSKQSPSKTKTLNTVEEDSW